MLLGMLGWIKSKREFLLALGVLGAVVLFVPLNNTVAPAVRLQVLDEAGLPAAGIHVEQQWDYYFIDSEPHGEVSKTNSAGYVDFPRRSVRVSLVRKLLTRVSGLMPHGSTGGANATVSAYGPDGAYDMVVCGINDPSPRQMRLKRLDLSTK
jgi:hypothetical protein